MSVLNRGYDLRYKMSIENLPMEQRAPLNNFLDNIHEKMRKKERLV